MSLGDTVKRRVLSCRLCLPGLVVAVLATAGIGYGLLTDDPVTSLGSLLLVPSAVLLFAIGIKEAGRSFDGDGRQLN